MPLESCVLCSPYLNSLPPPPSPPPALSSLYLNNPNYLLRASWSSLLTKPWPLQPSLFSELLEQSSVGAETARLAEMTVYQNHCVCGGAGWWCFKLPLCPENSTGRDGWMERCHRLQLGWHRNKADKYSISFRPYWSTTRLFSFTVRSWSSCLKNRYSVRDGICLLLNLPNT